MPRNNNARSSGQHISVNQIITEQICSILNEGVVPWEKPWVAGTCPARGYEMDPDDSYTGINRILLPKPGEYLTRKMVEKYHGQIIDPRQSYIVAYCLRSTASTRVQNDDESVDETVTLDDVRIKMLYYRVFHIDNISGVPSRVRTRSENADDMRPVAAAEEVISSYLARTGVRLNVVQGDRASYDEPSDTVTIPLMEQFQNEEHYYSVLFHELIHSTGHELRLCRDVDQAAYNAAQARYTREELVAEMGSAFLMSACGLDLDKVIRNKAARIQGWIEALMADNRMVIWAAKRAESAFRMVMGIE